VLMDSPFNEYWERQAIIRINDALELVPGDTLEGVPDDKIPGIKEVLERHGMTIKEIEGVNTVVWIE